ncbi:hypothetical protein D3C86_1827050 [compost metagenome]
MEHWGFALSHQQATIFQRVLTVLIEISSEKSFCWTYRIRAIDNNNVIRSHSSIFNELNAVTDNKIQFRIAKLARDTW